MENQPQIQLNCLNPNHQLLEEENKLLGEEIKRLHLEIADLKANNKELLDRLSKNSSNSHKPPSSDGYEKPDPKSQRKTSNKKPGGQIGHKGHCLEPVDNPDKVVIYEAETCKACGTDLSDIEETKHECRQEFDIPDIKPIVIEHRRIFKLCPECGFMNVEDFPDHITQRTQYGIRVKALSVYLNQYQFITFNRLSELFKDCYNLEISEGSLANFNRLCALNSTPAVEAIRNNILRSHVSGFDETGMRLCGKLHWLHAARTNYDTYYELHQKRGKEAMDEINILPHYTGIAIHDHWKSYYSYTNCTHGLCNAHHLRELEFINKRYAQQWVLEFTRFLLRIKDRVGKMKLEGEKTLSVNSLAYYKKEYRRILKEADKEIALLPTPAQSEKGKKKQHKAKNLWNRLYHYREDVLRFMIDFNVPFTNNGSERDMRMSKNKAKISGSFRSKQGADDFCKNRSYISTCKKRDINVLSALEDAISGFPFIPDPVDTS